MRRFRAELLGACVLAAACAAPAVAKVPAGSVDSCTATGGGTSYSLSIKLRTGVPAQGGFAFGNPDASVTNIAISGTDGTLATGGLPAHTSAAWTLSSSLAAGTLTADLVTTRPVTEPFVVAPSVKRGRYLGAIRCPLHSGPVSNAFMPATVETYQRSSKTWTEVVAVGAAGTVSFAAPLVQGGSVKAKGAGTVTLVLTPTAAGRAALAAKGVLVFNLKITFRPNGGAPASKSVVMVLRPV